jgi:predicted RNA methylase
MNATAYTSMNAQFYPTPEHIGRKLLRHVDWQKVTAILEPSAGKGDLLRLVKGQAKIVECIELDPNLQAILREQGYNVIGDDFLTHDTYTSYDLIIMNPPFADGAKHLLKALDLCKHGGQVCCILNAETLRNPCDKYREKLVDLLLEHGAKIEYVENGFSKSEHRTNVEVALVYVNIMPQEIDHAMFAGMEIAKEYADTHERFNEHQLATNDAIGNALRQYNDECRIGLATIDMYQRFEAILPRCELYGKNANPLLSLCVNSSELKDCAGKMNMKNLYIRELRYKYWKLLFQSDGFSRLLTQKAREKYQHNIQQMRSYDFTMSNIKALMLEMSQSLTGNIEDAILEQFEKLTYAHSMENSKNIHYFDGWKTNSAYMIKPKVIIPCYGIYDDRWSWASWSLYKTEDKLDELEKIFTYLDGGRTEGETVRQIMYRVNGNHYEGERIEFKYFSVEFKKKGTIHLWFKDLELLKKFNIFGANKKGWLPNGYGKKGYDDMTAEEQHVVDSFHCPDSKATENKKKAKAKKEYDNIVVNNHYYMQLETANMLMIGMEEQ